MNHPPATGDERESAFVFRLRLLPVSEFNSNQFHNPLMRGNLPRIPQFITSTTGL